MRSKEQISIGAKAPLAFRFAPLSPQEQSSEAMRDLNGEEKNKDKERHQGEACRWEF